MNILILKFLSFLKAFGVEIWIVFSKILFMTPILYGKLKKSDFEYVAHFYLSLFENSPQVIATAFELMISPFWSF